MKRKLAFSVILAFLGFMNAFASNIPPVAVLSSTPDQSWFYNLEQVMFDYYSSYDPDQYLTGTRWYIDGVLVEEDTYVLYECFALYGSPNTGCYQLADGQTTVTIKLGVKDLQGAWDYEEKTYTVQEHKGRKYFVTDHLGSVRATVNRDGNVLGYSDYYPFGLELRSNNTANPNDNYKFTGHERDEEAFTLGIDYMNARTYDPVIGRFMQIDPLADQFPGWTPYHYVHNNPLVLVDPTGMNGEWFDQGDTDRPAMAGGDCPEKPCEDKSAKASGSAEYLVHEKTSNGQRVAGAEYEGTISAGPASASGKISKFGAGYEGNIQPGSISGSVEVYAGEAELSGEISTEDGLFAMGAGAEGSVFSAEAGVHLGKIVGDDSSGWKVEAEAGAYIGEGSASATFTWFGLQVGVTYGASVGSAHLGGGFGFENNQGAARVFAGGHIGLGAGVKFGIDIGLANLND